MARGTIHTETLQLDDVGVLGIHVLAVGRTVGARAAGAAAAVGGLGALCGAAAVGREEAVADVAEGNEPPALLLVLGEESGHDGEAGAHYADVDFDSARGGGG